MNTRKSILYTLTFALLALNAFAEEKFATDEFAFKSSGLNLNGILSSPSNRAAKSIVLIIPGSGPTNVVSGNWFYDLRFKFTEAGVAVAVWDKPGCGKSEGKYGQEPTIEASAKEVADAVNYLKSNQVSGSHAIGLWSLSRGGWVAPVAISKSPEIKYWISISGTDAYETWGYLFSSNLALEGFTENEITKLYDEWLVGNKLFAKGHSYSEYQSATHSLRKNKLFQKFTGRKYVNFEPGSEDFAQAEQQYMEFQKAYLVKERKFDPETGLEIIVEDFEQILSQISIPVLALFGENDRHVDWRKTKELYERTIGKPSANHLKVVVFPNADHSIKLSKTGGYFETMQTDYWKTPYADGYYESKIDFVCSNSFCGITKAP